jgi:hypothetical protein
MFLRTQNRLSNLRNIDSYTFGTHVAMQKGLPADIPGNGHQSFKFTIFHRKFNEVRFILLSLLLTIHEWLLILD